MLLSFLWFYPDHCYRFAVATLGNLITSVSAFVAAWYVHHICVLDTLLAH